MNKEVKLYIFRHGETDYNKGKKLQGQLNTYLNETGKEQALNLGKKLEGKNIEVIISSDLIRAVETATIVAETIKVPILSFENLREVNLGDYEGTSIEKVIEDLGETFWDFWLNNHENDEDAKFSNGETKIEVRSRVLSFIEKFINQNEYKTIAVSTHGFVLNQILVHLRKSKNFKFQVANGSFITVSYKNGILSLCE